MFKKTFVLRKARLPGYPLHDRALQDVLFCAIPLDETPDGPTRTWVYCEGPAGESGCFEPIRGALTPGYVDERASEASL